MAIPIQTYPLIQDGFAVGGINLKSAVTSLADNESPYSTNITYGTIYALESRKGFSKIGLTAPPVDGIYQLKRSNGTSYNIVAAGTLFYSVTFPGPVVAPYAGSPTITAGAFYDFATLNDYAFMVDGVDPNLKFNGTTFYALGIPVPGAGPTLTEVNLGAGALPNGTYQYVVTFVNVDGEEGNPSPVSSITIAAGPSNVNITNIPLSPAPAVGAQQVVARRVYRTEVGGNRFFLVTTIADNVTTVFLDTVTDANLGIEVEFDNDVPPVLSMIETHKDRLWGVDPQFPSNLLFSKKFRHDQWPILNSIPVGLDDGDVITALVSFFDQLVVFKRKSIYVVSGDDNINFALQKAQTDDRIGALNNRVPSVIGNKVYFLSERGVYSFDGLRIEYESVKIEPFFDTARPQNVQTFNWTFERFAYGKNYKNGSKNWYFLAVPTSSNPENDFVLVLDTVVNAWTFFTGIKSNALAIVEEGNQPKLWSGDQLGFVWRLDDTDSDGYVHTASFSTSNTNGPNTLEDTSLASVISTATATGAATLTDNTLVGVVVNQYINQQIYISTGAGVGQFRTIIANTASPVTFTVSAPWGVVPAPGDGYIVGGLTIGGPIGVRVKIIEGFGEGQIARITANTPIQITVTPAWAPIPNTTSRYSIGFIEKEWNSKWINYNVPDKWKRLVYEHINTSRTNNILSELHVTVYFDFSTGSSFGDEVSLAGADSLWDVSLWDFAFWDTVLFIVSRLRAEGGHIHRYMQMKLYNDVGNEPFIVNSLGFQWQLKGFR